jgi:hypothetical protein
MDLNTILRRLEVLESRESLIVVCVKSERQWTRVWRVYTIGDGFEVDTDTWPKSTTCDGSYGGCDDPPMWFTVAHVWQDAEYLWSASSGTPKGEQVAVDRQPTRDDAIKALESAINAAEG